MGSHKRVRLYAEDKLQRSNRSVFSVILDNEDEGYWSHPNEMMCFFHKKITEEELDWYEEIEVTKEECKELFELLTKAKELHERVIGNRWSRLDAENKEHCKVYDAIAEMFIQCAFEKMDKLTALKTDKGCEIAAEIGNVIIQLANGEIGKIDSEPYKGIDFRRENNFLHMMLIHVCRYGEEWNGYKSSAV